MRILFTSMSSTEPSNKLNATPEILLRKRRNADRTRIEKQELARKRNEEKNKTRQKNRQKFIRAESIVSKTLATEREKERVKRISKLELKKAKKVNGSNDDLDEIHVASERDFILKITEKKLDSNNDDQDLAANDDENEDEEDTLIKEKIVYDGKPTLLFVIRVRGPTAVNIPNKVFKILSLLRLTEVNTGVFVKLTKSVYPLLKLVAPYIVIGEPSLSSTRSIVQKRSKIMYKRPEENEEKEIALNDNNIIEEQLGETGIICMEDIIHEINTMGESFQAATFFLLPFKLNREVSGFNSLNKLKRIKQKEDDAKFRQFSNSAVAPIVQVDIDELISKLN